MVCCCCSLQRYTFFKNQTLRKQSSSVCCGTKTTEYKNVERAQITSHRGSKGGTLYNMQIIYDGGKRLATTMGADNVDYTGRKTLVNAINAFYNHQSMEQKMSSLLSRAPLQQGVQHQQIQLEHQKIALERQKLALQQQQIAFQQQQLAQQQMQLKMQQQQQQQQQGTTMMAPPPPTAPSMVPVQTPAVDMGLSSSAAAAATMDGDAPPVYGEDDDDTTDSD
jgi:hypothetical protein